MKVGILTFYFAYNYGAMLQAYALKKYMTDHNADTCIVPYYPASFRRNYSISPLQKGISVKRRIRNLLYYIYKVRQAKLFDDFKKNMLLDKGNAGKEFDSDRALSEYCINLDSVVFGSDQVWNTDIVLDLYSYFGKEIETQKISYAASVGSISADKIKAANIEEYLNRFNYISVREEYSRNVIGNVIEKPVEVVCDPVFLLPLDEWKQLANRVNVIEPYILLYMLKEDQKLIEYAQKISSETKCRIYSVHPTLNRNAKNVKLLKTVGPREFLYLIEHAAAVVTNSFHGVSFSIIYRKRLIHIPNADAPDRTLNLLSKLDVLPDNEIYDIDFSKMDYSLMKRYIEESQDFLNNAVLKI